ncbi:SMP-30/gluconolactonase/LRE family protein [Pontixanthobacter aquaemixtae]|uniref:SMP-30/gluconolactonase/LRE family protein n=1 Tax=Pontixanthobacter aquaemixtae TaxID=1958940 RepID=UPI001F1EFD5F|nr:SMP-30/gluconolactonase/LRE family protein [Pontixanthobacter aquaemixtae]
MRTGPDGRIYVAQVPGSSISAIDPDSGAVETICAIDGPVTAPDDLVFDEHGNMFITEVTLGKVSMLSADGAYRVVNGAMPVANPITMHEGRLIAGECRPDGRVMELDKDTGAERLILENAPMPNAFTVGPDGKLYMPMMAVNEIWRIDLQGGDHEVVAGDLGVPDSVKFDSKGRIVSTQVASGDVLRIDPQTGEREVLATVAPGLDNCTFVGDRLFVSSISGQVNEVLSDGTTKNLVPDGLQWPMGLALGEDGSLFIADGAYSYLVDPDGTRQTIGFLFYPGYPGFARGVAADGPGQWLTTNAGGQVMRWNLASQESEVVAEGFEVLFGVTRAQDGSAIFADGAAGRVLHATNGSVEELASGLDRPMGVAVSSGGKVFVSENRAGRVVSIKGGATETVIDGLREPQGIAIHADRLFILDVGDRSLVSAALDGSDRQTIASNLPVKAPPGVTPKILGGVGNLSGPMESFAGIAVAADGTIYVSGDAEGSVLSLAPVQ